MFELGPSLFQFGCRDASISRYCMYECWHARSDVRPHRDTRPTNLPTIRVDMNTQLSFHTRSSHHWATKDVVVGNVERDCQHRLIPTWRSNMAPTHRYIIQEPMGYLLRQSHFSMQARTVSVGALHWLFSNLLRGGSQVSCSGTARSICFLWLSRRRERLIEKSPSLTWWWSMFARSGLFVLLW